MANKKKILYVQTSGVDTPKRLYSPFVLGMTAKAMDIDATIYFLGLGITVVKKGEAEKVKEGNFPTVKEIMDQAAAAGVEFLVCEQSTQLLNLDRGDFVEGAKVVGAATLNDLVLDADGTMWF
ncbi:MAG TPA: sulfur reduction protein DsrE [Dehalococcoidia bacterium]|jgi:predicted peroxiredoxin|nr:sulfur reduction protein DsrE [Dehalococcoidia bacterium]